MISWWCRVDRRGVKHARTKGAGQNTESFDPSSTLVRSNAGGSVDGSVERKMGR